MRKLIFTASFLLIFFPQTLVSAQNEPFVQVVPSTVVRGQETVIYGRGFCGLESCSQVTIKQENFILASNVKVDTEGKFQFSFTVNGALDSNTITATQTAADGTLIQAKTGINIAAGDYPPGYDRYKTPEPSITPNPLTAKNSPPTSPKILLSPTPQVTPSGADNNLSKKTNLGSYQGTGFTQGLTLVVLSLVAGVLIGIGISKYRNKFEDIKRKFKSR